MKIEADEKDLLKSVERDEWKSAGGGKRERTRYARPRSVRIKVVATNATSVVLPNTGHSLMEENPSGTTDALLRFLETASTSSALPPMRMTPAEVNANQTGSDQIGSSGLAGVSTKVLFGDPSNAGSYTIVLFVPPHTTIPAHSHHDDRMATVVSGTWQFGCGDRFDEGALKNLAVGSVYSEPGRMNHFARTGAEPVLVEISGFGPTDTHYVNPADAPGIQNR